MNSEAVLYPHDPVSEVFAIKSSLLMRDQKYLSHAMIW